MNAFNNIIGYESIKQELVQIADTLKNREVYEALGASSPRGLMLYGKPGVGKTTMADALIKESRRKSFVCRKTKGGDSFIDDIVETFKKAEKDAPSLVLLDDLDKFANEDDGHRDAEEYVTVQACIDDLRGKEVFVLATVNNTSKLPRSLLRHGRFDRQIEVPTPNRADSEAIIRHYLEKKKLGVELDMDRLDKVYEDFLKLADKKKDITDDEILVLAGADRNDNHHIKLEFLQVTSGIGVRSVASLGLNIAGERFESAASGNGPVDAAIKALKKIIDRHMELKEFTIQAISKGSDDMGKVHMQVEYDGQMYYGFGANTDIIAASVEAYIDCINKFKR